VGFPCAELFRNVNSGASQDLLNQTVAFETVTRNFSEDSYVCLNLRCLLSLLSNLIFSSYKDFVTCVLLPLCPTAKVSVLLFNALHPQPFVAPMEAAMVTACVY
jgi:hypothetical protein